MRKIAIILFALVAFASNTFSQETRLLRFPTVNGNQVVFTYAGDLYTVPLTGGIARKLTNNVGYEMFAHFSPDGSKIAFTGQYDGNTEVFTIPSQGGVPQRLTYTATLNRDDVSDRMGPNNIVMSWTPDGKSIVYRSRKQTFDDFVGQLFKVSINGGLSEELPLMTGGFCSYSPDGKKLAFNKVFREFRTWKYYKGGMADDISIFDFDTKEIKNITNTISQEIIPMWIGDDIYFLSDRDRTMNMFAYNTKSGETTKVTNFTEYDIKFPSFSDKTIVFENGGYIYKYDVATKATEKIPITVIDDFIYSRSAYKDASKNIFSGDIAPNGERVVFSARGDIYTVPAEKGITRNLTNSSDAHDRAAVWSPDGKYIAYLSDKSGEYEVYMQQQDGSTEAVKLTDGTNNYIFRISWSPDSKKILFNDRLGRLQYVDVTTKKITLVEKSQYGPINNYSWSPDSKWIAYTTTDMNRFHIITVYNLENTTKQPVTDNWYESYQPIFSNDGKYLLFISDRDFNPIYSSVEWNYAYKDMSKIYMILLSKETPSPFALENNEVATNQTESAKQIENKTEKGSKDAQKKETTSINVKIDFDGILSRIIALPVEVSSYDEVNCIDGKIYYNQYSSTGKQIAKLYDLTKKTETEIADSITFTISSNGKKMLVQKNSDYSIIDLPTSKINIEKTLDLSNMKVWVDYHKEWKQIYDESWRQMRDFFYVENMHGLDWKAMHKKYDALIPYVNHRADLTYVIGELIGELSIGHAYINSGEKPEPDRIKLGLLGAKFSKHSSGYFQINQILDGLTWNKTLNSPLREVGVNVSKGDFILAVDGQNLQNINDIYSTLIDKADKTVELVVNSKPELAGSRKVLVTPIASESNLYYYTWVQNNIKKVTEATNGEVGYIHIPDMGVEGLNEFVKYFYPQLTKKALIIDDRGNGGGNVSPMILERLSRIVYRQTMRRGSPYASTIPAQTHIGPKVLLLNRYSASDGDLFPYGFQKLGLGVTIGTRSWGGVVGITGSLPFVDGADLRKPEFASFSSEASQWIIEGHGVDPDIVIDNDSYKEYIGIDEQLSKAIEVIKEKLKNFKSLPPIPADPDKSK
ncbi:MAG: PD40 domain-containing protein [Bacteroidales bacterium]|nr:PD40 domain-containing protein [Bacteroidales bacterium]